MPVTKGSKPVPRIDFGAQPADLAVVLGLALLEDDFAPPGTLIEARVGGQQCGTAIMPDPKGHYIGDRMFELHIFGAAEQHGCATRGDQVELLVGGVPAAEPYSWLPFTEVQTFGQFKVVYLTAMRNRAWYWMQTESEDGQVDGTLVEALVNGNVCGETPLRTAKGLGYYAPNGLAGFSKLIVPSEDIQPGCGRPDATVTFTVNGVAIGSTTWQPGLQEVQLDLSKAGVQLPPTGSGSAGSSRAESILIALASALAALGAGMIALSLARVALPHRH